MLEESGALLSGHFRLSSGLHSPGYVQCARLLEHPRNARRLGEELAAMIGTRSADQIVAPALGGLIIGYTVAQALDLPFLFTERKDGAMTLRRGFSIEQGSRVVIVEDVVTTGKSTAETAAVIEAQGGAVAGYASILNRSGRDNPFPLPYDFLLALQLDTYPPDECPLCREGVALDAPGSRFTQGGAA